MTDVERDLGEQLVRMLPVVRRALIRATRAAEGLPALPEAQVAVLRTLAREGPLSPAQIADRMHLARPTVSNLVREMTAEDLLERKPSPVDKRSVLLVPTTRASGVLTSFTRGRDQVLAQALADLPAKERDRLGRALPALEQVLKNLEAMAGPGTETDWRST